MAGRHEPAKFIAARMGCLPWQVLSEFKSRGKRLRDFWPPAAPQDAARSLRKSIKHFVIDNGQTVEAAAEHYKLTVEAVREHLTIAAQPSTRRVRALQKWGESKREEPVASAQQKLDAMEYDRIIARGVSQATAMDIVSIAPSEAGLLD
jgi:hypothetical protein